jgi:S23 ribosomal protein.
MEKITRFEDLEIWKRGMQLAVKTYEIMRECKDYGFRDQIQRASVSIPSNISEGYERHTNKEYIHYLYIAKGSCGELRTQMYLAKEFGYIKKNDFETLLDKAKHLSSMLSNMIKARQNFT